MKYFPLRVIGLWFLAFTGGLIGYFTFLLTIPRGLENSGSPEPVIMIGDFALPVILLIAITGYLLGIFLTTIGFGAALLKRPKNVLGAFLGTIDAGIILILFYYFAVPYFISSIEYNTTWTPIWLLLLLWPISAVFPTIGMLVMDKIQSKKVVDAPKKM